MQAAPGALADGSWRLTSRWQEGGHPSPHEAAEAWADELAPVVPLPDWVNARMGDEARACPACHGEEADSPCRTCYSTGQVPESVLDDYNAARALHHEG